MSRNDADDAPRVYRTLPAQVVGWGLMAGALVLAAFTLRDLLEERSTEVIAPLALIAGLAAAAWVLFLRPRATVHSDRVELTNVITDTTIPFSQVEDVTFQWALELHDRQGRRHSSWAVPVRREMTRRRNIDDFAETTRRRGSAGATAQGASDEVLRAISRWKLDGSPPPVGVEDAPPRPRVAWPAVVALGVALALTVVALLG